MGDSIIKDVVIVGAGPSGLMAGFSAMQNGLDALILEAGPHYSVEREEHIRHIGVGGAGLFSDGKFSYYPSGSKLYSLMPEDRLLKSYHSAISIIERSGILTEDFPNHPTPSCEEFATNYLQKKYPSHVSTFKQRTNLLDHLLENKESCLLVCTTFLSAKKTISGKYLIRYIGMDGVETEITSKRLIFAMGRLGNISLKSELSRLLRISSNRVEIGVRVETSADNRFWKKYNSTDIKLLWRSDTARHRTFCTCRNGEVLALQSGGFTTVSGRADISETGYSNFAVLAERSHGDDRETSCSVNKLKSKIVHWQPLLEFLDKCDRIDIDTRARPWSPADLFKRSELRETIPGNMLKGVIEGLKKFVAKHPELLTPDTICIFPAIERTGLYPATDDGLRVLGESIWIAGDQTGKFRGLIPALVSGYFTGLSALNNN